LKRLLKTVVKLAISCLAFYLVFRKISWNELVVIFRQVEFFWICAAFLIYNASQFVSAARLWLFYLQLDIPLSYWSNLSLYYKAMYYGLFLPGGISGDAYKVLRLQTRYSHTYSELIFATLSDRVNGLVVLLSIGMMMTFSANKQLEAFVGSIRIIIVIALIAGWLFYAWLMYAFGKPFHKLIIKASILSFIIQLLQLVAFFCILQSLAIDSSQWIYYGILFYAGSILSAVPVSIGGMGMREWVMVTGAGIFMLHQGYGVTASFSFFMIASLSSLCGLFFNFPTQGKN
jgi:glycosyltransferase 2 family protein